MSEYKFSKQAELDFMHNFSHISEGDRWAKHEIESLRQQLVIRDAEIAELKNNVTICVVCIRELRQQLSAKDDIIRKFRRAIGDHCAPNDCYATGPLTGNAFLDLVECPACSAIAAYEEALAATDPKK